MTFAALRSRLTLAAALSTATVVGACSDIVLPGVADDSTGASGSSGTADGGTPSDITASTLDPSNSASASNGSTDEADGTTSGGVTDSSEGGPATTGSSSGDGSGSDGATTGTESGGSSSSETTAPGSTGPGSTSMTDPSTSSSSSDGGSVSGTTGPCVPSGVGNYNACLDGAFLPNSLLCGFPGAVCINDGGTPAFVSVCSQPTCVDACDCPAAPGTGDPTVACEDITGEGDAECYLDCENGETCPDDMACFLGFVCVHDSGTGTGTDYGLCEDNGDCPIGDLCIVDDRVLPTFGVCSDQGCASAANCPAAPATGTAPVTCQDITGSTNDCFLSCAAGETCPVGMQCFMNFLCMWPIP